MEIAKWNMKIFIGDYEEIIVTSFGDHETVRGKTWHAHIEYNDQYT